MQANLSNNRLKPDITSKQPHKLLATLTSLPTTGKKAVAVLLDPDTVGPHELGHFFQQIGATRPDFFFVGGSLITNYRQRELIAALRQHSDRPVVLFPGNPLHIEPSADALLLLSLISGRNAEFLIGQHVVAAPLLRSSGLEILSTAYMLVDGGAPTTVSYISNTTPLPHDKPGIAACTALAGEMLGLKLTYLDAGSGARRPVPPALIRAVRESVASPIVVGGGINTAEKAYDAFAAGADVVVVGNQLEKDPAFLRDVVAVAQSFTSSYVQA